MAARPTVRTPAELQVRRPTSAGSRPRNIETFDPAGWKWTKANCMFTTFVVYRELLDHQPARYRGRRLVKLRRHEKNIIIITIISISL